MHEFHPRYNSLVAMHAGRLLLLAAYIVVGPRASAQSIEKVGLYAKTLYVPSVQYGKEEQFEKDRFYAVQYVQRSTRSKLASDLRKVRERYGLRTPEGVGATCLMAIHKIDLQANLRRLETLHIGQKYEAIEGVPAALAEIAIRNNSGRAARLLVAMKTDGHLAEDQANSVVKLFLQSPTLLIKGIASRESLWRTFREQLKFGADDSEVGRPRIRAIARSHVAGSHGRERRLWTMVAHL